MKKKTGERAHLQARRVVRVEAQDARALPTASRPARRGGLARRGAAASDSAAGASRARRARTARTLRQRATTTSRRFASLHARTDAASMSAPGGRRKKKTSACCQAAGARKCPRAECVASPSSLLALGGQSELVHVAATFGYACMIVSVTRSSCALCYAVHTHRRHAALSLRMPLYLFVHTSPLSLSPGVPGAHSAMSSSPSPSPPSLKWAYCGPPTSSYGFSYLS